MSARIPLHTTLCVSLSLSSLSSPSSLSLSPLISHGMSFPFRNTASASRVHEKDNAYLHEIGTPKKGKINPITSFKNEKSLSIFSFK